MRLIGPIEALQFVVRDRRTVIQPKCHGYGNGAFAFETEGKESQMHGGVNYKVGRLAIAIVGAMLIGGEASAADLGGNCCADLEERIAELEATTARKGNRKVSLTVSGWVSQQVIFWDDGVESNVYVSDIGATIASNAKFTGQATIAPGWSAGYVLHLETNSSDPLLGINAGVADGPRLGGLAGIPAGGVSVLNSYWFIKSDQLGKINVGLQSQASDNAAILPDGSGTLLPANYVAFDYGGFRARNAATDAQTILPWLAIFGCNDCNGHPSNNIRYDSPTYGGFSVSTSYGESDFWDVAARYAGEFHDFKLAVGGAFSKTSRDSNSVIVTLADTTEPAHGVDFLPSATGINLLQAQNSEHFQIGAYLEHIPTGLFLYGAYTHLDVDDSSNTKNITHYIKGGVRQRWTPLGHTVLYGEYENGKVEAGSADVSEGNLWGLGIVQEIDAASMSMWLSYRHVGGDVAGGPNLDDFQYVKFGALINF